MNTARCEWSDLPTTDCAHCLGHGAPIGEPTPAEPPRATGRVVWTEKGPQDAQNATSAPRGVKAAPVPTDDANGPQIAAHPTAAVGRDLTEIVDMYERLAAQAEDQASHSLMPGGRAMVALGNVANMEAWENHQQATERYADHPDERLRRIYTSVEDEDPDEAWSPYQLLEFWSEAWRREHGAEYDTRPTLGSEANFIRWALDWAWSNEPAWDDFAADVRRARVKLEDILHAGNRVELSRIVCPDCDDAPRLIVLRGSADDGSDDRWKCQRCKTRFTPEGARKAHAKMLRSEGAERWVHQADAIATLKAQGRSERTVRAWLAEGEGKGYCDPVKHQVWVWWPDLWHKHLATPTRNRGRIGA